MGESFTSRTRAPVGRRQRTVEGNGGKCCAVGYSRKLISQVQVILVVDFSHPAHTSRHDEMGREILRVVHERTGTKPWLCFRSRQWAGKREICAIVAAVGLIPLVSPIADMQNLTRSEVMVDIESPIKLARGIGGDLRGQIVAEAGRARIRQ